MHSRPGRCSAHMTLTSVKAAKKSSWPPRGPGLYSSQGSYDSIPPLKISLNTDLNLKWKIDYLVYFRPHWLRHISCAPGCAKYLTSHWIFDGEQDTVPSLTELSGVFLEEPLRCLWTDVLWLFQTSPRPVFTQRELPDPLKVRRGSLNQVSQ